MSKKKSTVQKKIGIVLSVIGIIAMLLFTILPYFSAI